MAIGEGNERNQQDSHSKGERAEKITARGRRLREGGIEKISEVKLYTLGTSELFAGQWHPTPVLLPGKSHGWRSLVGHSPWGHYESDTTERLHFQFHFHALEKEMVTHSNVLAWRIPWTEEPGWLQHIGSQRVRHDYSSLACTG